MLNQVTWVHRKATVELVVVNEGISSDETYLWARAFQLPFTLEIAQKVSENLVRFGENLDVLGCLIDIRGTKSVSTILDKYKFAYEKAGHAMLPRHWKYAFLIDIGDDSPGFIETVMKNAGYLFQVFENESKAVDWLKGIQSG